MERVLYILALILVIIWALGFFLYSLGALIHLLLLIAVIIIIIKFSRRRRY